MTELVDVSDLAVIDYPGAIPEVSTMPRHLSYRQIADDLAARIEAEEYGPGQQLPSYAGLADLYSVSVSTAYRAVSLLIDRGLVEGSQGRGVFVREDDEE